MHAAKIGHAHLKGRDLNRAIAFYTQFLGLVVTERLGERYAFLSTGELHHDLALQALGPTAAEVLPHGIGLYLVAFEVADKAALRAAYERLTAAAIPVSAVDDLISWALYFADPDGNGLEIYCDTRHSPNGHATWQGHIRPIKWSAPSAAG